MRGIYNTSGENETASVEDLSQALNSELKKTDLADFFYENRAGKLTKTKTIYMIYSMMSDYGTHRNEATQENPTLEDALFSLRLMDSILFWVYSKKK
jgi:predicted ATPase